MTMEKQPTSVPTAIPTFNSVHFDDLNWHLESEIPEGVSIFDLESLSQGKDLDKLKKLLENTIPFYIKNFGIPESEIEAIYNKTRDFFKKPDEEKEKMVHEKWPPILRGYSPYGTGAYENNMFNGRAVQQYCKYAWGPSENVYPDEEFLHIYQNYIEKLNRASERVLDCIGEAMDLKENDQWQNLFGGEETVLHCQVYYPEHPRGKERMIAHADGSSITMLNQLPAPSGHVGLQCKIGDEFVGIPPIRGTIVVMTSETLNSFTNSRIKPVIHAVTGPKTDVENSERSSMPFFVNPRYELKMKCPQETTHAQFYNDDEGMCFGDFADNIHRAYERVENLRKQNL